MSSVRDGLRGGMEQTKVLHKQKEGSCGNGGQGTTFISY